MSRGDADPSPPAGVRAPAPASCSPRRSATTSSCRCATAAPPAPRAERSPPPRWRAWASSTSPTAPRMPVRRRGPARQPRASTGVRARRAAARRARRRPRHPHPRRVLRRRRARARRPRHHRRARLAPRRGGPRPRRPRRRPRRRRAAPGRARRRAGVTRPADAAVARLIGYENVIDVDIDDDGNVLVGGRPTGLTAPPGRRSAGLRDLGHRDPRARRPRRASRHRRPRHHRPRTPRTHPRRRTRTPRTRPPYATHAGPGRRSQPADRTHHDGPPRHTRLGSHQRPGEHSPAAPVMLDASATARLPGTDRGRAAPLQATQHCDAARPLSELSASAVSPSSPSEGADGLHRNQKTPAISGDFLDAGGGTRTPDTRIMIPA